MKRFIVQENDFPNIIKNQTSSMQISRMSNSYGLRLAFYKTGNVLMTAAEVLLDVAQVRVSIQDDAPGNGTIHLVDNVLAADLFMLDRFRNYAKSNYDVTTPPGVITLDYTRDQMPYFVSESALGIGALNLTNYVLAITFKNPTALTVTKIEVFQEVDYEAKRPLGQHLRVKGLDRSYAQAALEAVNELPTETGTGLIAQHIGLGSTPGVISYVQLKLDKNWVHEKLTPALNARLLHENKRTAQAGFFSMDFQRDFGWLPVGKAQNLSMKINWTTAPASYYILQETIHGLIG